MRRLLWGLGILAVAVLWFALTADAAPDVSFNQQPALPAVTPGNSTYPYWDGTGPIKWVTVQAGAAGPTDTPAPTETPIPPVPTDTPQPAPTLAPTCAAGIMLAGTGGQGIQCGPTITPQPTFAYTAPTAAPTETPQPAPTLAPTCAAGIMLAGTGAQGIQCGPTITPIPPVNTSTPILGSNSTLSTSTPVAGCVEYDSAGGAASVFVCATFAPTATAIAPVNTPTPRSTDTPIPAPTPVGTAAPFLTPTPLSGSWAEVKATNTVVISATNVANATATAVKTGSLAANGVYVYDASIGLNANQGAPAMTCTLINAAATPIDQNQIAIASGETEGCQMHGSYTAAGTGTDTLTIAATSSLGNEKIVVDAANASVGTKHLTYIDTQRIG